MIYLRNKALSVLPFLFMIVSSLYASETEDYTYTCNNSIISDGDLEANHITDFWHKQGNVWRTNNSHNVNTGHYAIGMNNNSGTAGIYQKKPASEGQTFSLSAFAKSSSGSGDIGIYFLNASNHVIHEHDQDIASSDYKEYYVSGTAPAGTAYVQAYGRIIGNGTFFVDTYCLQSWNINQPPSCNISCDNTNDFDDPVMFLDPTGSNNGWLGYLNSNLEVCNQGDGSYRIRGSVLSGNDAQGWGGTGHPCGAQDGYYIDLHLTDGQTWAEFGGNYEESPAAPNHTSWDYYQVSGTYTGLGCNAGTTVDILSAVNGYRMQVGMGANKHDPHEFGFATWFIAKVNGNTVLSDLYASFDDSCYDVCNNVTYGGLIGQDQSGCGNTYNPSTLQNVAHPSGGSGTIEYIWLKSTETCEPPVSENDSRWDLISGATNPSYDPGPISETTCYLRCSRRNGCISYDGESNVVTVEVFTDGIAVNIPEDNTSLCAGDQIVLQADVSNASSCGEPGDSDCNHTLYESGGWVENPSYAAYCGQAYGAKLWTNGGEGTSFVEVDFGHVVPSGTTICVNMKLAHCSNTSSHESNARIQFWKNSSNSHVNLKGQQKFSNENYQEFCYTLGAGEATKYIKVSDNGACAFRVDYVRYETQGTQSSSVTYAWSGPGIIGAANGSTVTVDQPGIYSVAVSDCNGCEDVDEIEITNNQFQADAGGDETICEGESAQLSGNSVAGATYEWRIEGSSNVVSNSRNYTVSPSETTLYVLTISKDGCEESDDVQVNVEMPPLVTLDPVEAVCAGAAAFQLEANPTGGSFSGTGVTNQGVFDPSSSGSGTFEINYSFTDGNGCLGMASINVTVNEAPIVTLDPVSALCANESAVALSASPAGGSFSGTGVNGSEFDPAVSGNGTFTISYSYTDVNGCSASDEIDIVVNEQPVAAVSADPVTVCTGGSTELSVDVSGGDGNNTYEWSDGLGSTSSVTASDINAESTYSVTVTDGNGCSDIAEVTVMVDDKATVGDFVFNDINFNGIQDAGDDGIQNVSVSLYDTDDNLISSTSTSENGSYSFEVCAGEYYLIFGDLEGNVRSPQGEGTNDLDSDANASTGRTDNFTIQAGENNTDLDAGYGAAASIGDYVFEDTNNNGLQDAGDKPLSGVTVILTNASGETISDINGNVVGDVTSGPKGEYLFSNLVPGDYIVVFTRPENYNPAMQDAGGATGDEGDANNDSDINDLGESYSITLSSGENEEDVDAGFTTIADLSLIKTVTPSNPLVGEMVAFTIEVSNSGPNNATGVKIEDVIPNGYSAISGISTNGTFSNDMITWESITVSANSSISLTYSATVEASGTTISYVNVAEVAESDQYDPDSTPGNGADTNGEGGIGSEDPDGSQDSGDEDDGDDAEVMPISPGVDIQKLTNGEDADEAPGPFVFFQDGTTQMVTWTYIVTNTGNTNLINVRVVDDVEGQVGVIPMLAAGESTTLSASGPNVEGQYKNNALVFGQPVDNEGNPAGDEVEDIDPSHYFGFNFNIDIEPEELTACPGEEVDYTISIRQNSTVPDGFNVEFRNIMVEQPFAPTMLMVEDVPGQFDIDQDEDGDGFLDSNEGEFQWTLRTVLNETITDQVMDMFTAVTIDLSDNTELASVDLMGVDPFTFTADPDACGSIGNFAFYDANQNGIQDDRINPFTMENLGPELPVEGVVMQLLDENGDVVDTQMTGSNGMYLFTNVVPGTYTVRFDNTTFPDAAYVLSPSNEGGDDSVDSDIPPVTYTSGNIEIGPGEEDLSTDIGFYRSQSPEIFDPCACNNDFIYGAGVDEYLFAEEVVVAGTEGETWGIIAGPDPVTGISTNGIFIKDANGNPVLYNPSVDGSIELTPDPMHPDTFRFNFFHETESGYGIVVSNGTDILSIGNLCTNTPEPDNEIVSIFCTSDEPIQLTEIFAGGIEEYFVLNANGPYVSGDAIPNDYRTLPQITEIVPEDYEDGDQIAIVALWIPDEDPNGLLESCEKPSVVNISFVVESGCLTSLGDTTWVDANANGLYDDGEAALGGVEVTLFRDGSAVTLDGFGDPLTNPTTTNSDGFYTFDNLTPGDYQVQFGDVDGFARSPLNIGSEDGLDSDADPLTGLTGDYTLVKGVRDNSVDAGYYETTGLGDLVWIDEDGDGEKDADENGLNGVIVNLYVDADKDGDPDDAGNPFATTTTSLNVGTGNNGYYQFDNIDPNTYVVEFIDPDGIYIFSPQDQGGDEAADSDVNPATGLTDPIMLMSGDSNQDVDAGVFLPASIGNIVWNDADGDGVLEAGEELLSGFSVSLTDQQGEQVRDINNMLVGNQVTGMNGNPPGEYSFDNLVPGMYIVTFVTPSGFVLTEADAAGGDTNTDDGDTDTDSDANAITGASHVINLSSGETDDRVDAGFFLPASLGDFVWSDLDGDGIEETGEDGINGITVNLYTDEDMDGVLESGQVPFASTTTGDDPVSGDAGFYEFTNLPAGGYLVEVIADDLIITLQDQGSDDSDSDINPENGLSSTVNLSPGENNPTIDAGLYEGGAIGDIVWQDIPEQNGMIGTANIYDSDIDIIVSDVNVMLLKENEDGVFVMVDQQNTTALGYLFDGLPMGNYQVKFTAPGGFTFVSPNEGDIPGDDTDAANDSDADGATGLTEVIMLEAGEVELTWDAGLTLPPVPVELISFSGKWNEDKEVNELEWLTATEINNDYFNVERSAGNTMNFEEVGKVNGNGTVFETQTYAFNDRSISENGIYFYRLKQVDFDGTASYSDIIAIRVEREQDTEIVIYPNPTVEYINVDVKTDQQEDIVINIFDMAGKLVKTKKVEAGNVQYDNVYRLDVSGLAAGLYNVITTVGTEIFSDQIDVIR